MGSVARYWKYPSSATTFPRQVLEETNAPIGGRISELLERSIAVYCPPSAVPGFSLPVQSAPWRETNHAFALRGSDIAVREIDFAESALADPRHGRDAPRLRWGKARSVKLICTTASRQREGWDETIGL